MRDDRGAKLRPTWSRRPSALEAAFGLASSSETLKRHAYLYYPSIYFGRFGSRLRWLVLIVWAASLIGGAFGLVLVSPAAVAISAASHVAILAVFAAIVAAFHRRAAMALVNDLLTIGLCPQCLYEIADSPESDGETIICPECGAVWYSLAAKGDRPSR